MDTSVRDPITWVALGAGAPFSRRGRTSPTERFPSVDRFLGEPIRPSALRPCRPCGLRDWLFIGGWSTRSRRLGRRTGGSSGCGGPAVGQPDGQYRADQAAHRECHHGCTCLARRNWAVAAGPTTGRVRPHLDHHDVAVLVAARRAAAGAIRPRGVARRATVPLDRRRHPVLPCRPTMTWRAHGRCGRCPSGSGHLPHPER